MSKKKLIELAVSGIFFAPNEDIKSIWNQEAHLLTKEEWEFEEEFHYSDLN